jgi:hypothetical protein
MYTTMHTFTIAFMSTLSLSVYAASIGDPISQLVTRERHNRHFHSPDFDSANPHAGESFERPGKLSPRFGPVSLILGSVDETLGANNPNTVDTVSSLPVVNAQPATPQPATNVQAPINAQAQAAINAQAQAAINAQAAIIAQSLFEAQAALKVQAALTVQAELKVQAALKVEAELRAQLELAAQAVLKAQAELKAQAALKVQAELKVQETLNAQAAFNTQAVVSPPTSPPSQLGSNPATSNLGNLNALTKSLSDLGTSVLLSGGADSDVVKRQSLPGPLATLAPSTSIPGAVIDIPGAVQRAGLPTREDSTNDYSEDMDFSVEEADESEEGF